MAAARKEQIVIVADDCHRATADQPARMKIIFLTRCLNYGGAERQLVTLAKGLHARGHRVAVTVFYRGGELEYDLRQAGVPVKVLDKGSRWDSLGFLWRLIRFIRRERPDVLHGYLIFPNILTVLLKLIVPRIRTAWGLRDSILDRSYYDWLERILYRAERWLSRFADVIIVNSRAGLDYAEARGFPREKMIVVPNGIDTQYFRPDKEAGRKLRAEWGVKDGEMLIGLVGRLDPMKDHPTFLKAAAALARNHNNLRCVCVGDGPPAYRRALLDLSNRLGLAERIIWAGAHRDAPAVYNALDICVSSSYGEGFSNVIGEAMACGIPCVVTDVGDSAWIVGEEGEVVPPKNAEALQSAIEKAMQRIRASGYDSQYNRQRIIDLFSVHKLVAKTEATLIASGRELRAE